MSVIATIVCLFIGIPMLLSLGAVMAIAAGALVMFAGLVPSLLPSDWNEPPSKYRGGNTLPISVRLLETRVRALSRARMGLRGA
jgi:hypothetical protein